MFEKLVSSKTALALSYVLVLVIGLAVFYLVPAIRYASIVEPKVKDISSEAFYAKYKENPERYVFLDVRGADAYDRLHAAGAKLQPLHTLYTERYNLPKNDANKEIVLICSGGVASGVAYSYLQHYGFRNIVRIENGIEAWQAAGLPVEGSSVIQ
jgi:rhodanese-related sulfurtransferase